MNAGMSFNNGCITDRVQVSQVCLYFFDLPSFFRSFGCRADKKMHRHNIQRVVSHQIMELFFVVFLCGSERFPRLVLATQTEQTAGCGPHMPHRDRLNLYSTNFKSTCDLTTESSYVRSDRAHGEEGHGDKGIDAAYHN